MAKGKFGEQCIERHSILIADRGGSRRIFQPVDLSSIDWARGVDQKTSATVKITGRSCRAQASLLGTIEPRRHELVIFRGSERVWEGPIVQTRSTSNLFEISANDVLEYLDNAALSKRWPNSEEGGQPIMTERLREIINYELTQEYLVSTSAGDVTIPRWETISKPANVLPYLDIRLGTTLTRSVTEAFEMSVGEHLYNLGRSIGVNYTTVGRSIVIWDGSIGRTRTVTEKDFSGDFEVIGAGSNFYNIAHVVSTNVEEGQEPVSGHAVNDLDYYGPWERVISTSSEDSESDAPTATELNTQARRAISNRYPVPIEMIAANGASLIPSPGLTMAHLVAGVELPVRAAQNIKPIKQLQRLDFMQVTEDSNGEKISATLSALGEVASV